MGRALGRLLRDAGDLRAVGGIASDQPAEGPEAIGYPQIVPVDRADSILRDADAVVDFSAPEQVALLLGRCAKSLAGRALLIGTTGLTEDLQAALETQAESSAVLVAANFSVGANLLEELVARAARTLPADRYDIEIVETHHRRKEDAPSGTALSLGRVAAGARGRTLDETRRDGRSGRGGPRPGGEIGFHAVRGGDVVGEHSVHFLGETERITLRHAALSRDLFAEGALLAARWLVGRSPGRYTMRQVLGL